MQSCKKRTWLHFQTFSFLKKCWLQHSIDGAKTFSLSGLIKLLVQSHSLVCCPCISKIQQMYLYLHFNNGSSFFTWNREKFTDHLSKCMSSSSYIITSTVNGRHSTELLLHKSEIVWRHNCSNFWWKGQWKLKSQKWRMRRPGNRTIVGYQCSQQHLSLPEWFLCFILMCHSSAQPLQFCRRWNNFLMSHNFQAIVIVHSKPK